MPDQVHDLPPTAFAVLGLLAIDSFTAYELKQQAQRSLRFVWPKADTILYAQPRRLEELGLARSEIETHNGRRRNRYWITDDGRRALRAWLATPSGPPQLEYEPILRLLLADQGTLADARQTVIDLYEWAIDRTKAGLQILESYGLDNEPFPERRHLKLLTAVFTTSLGEAALASCEFALAELDRWNSTQDAKPSAEMETLIDDIADRLRAAVERSATRIPAQGPLITRRS